jgi:hypothetical protein
VTIDDVFRAAVLVLEFIHDVQGVVKGCSFGKELRNISKK